MSYAFEQYLLAYRTVRGRPLSSNSILLLIQKIQNLLDFLNSSGVCRLIDYPPQTVPTGKRAARQLEEKELAAALKLPAPGVLESLAGIYYRLTTAPEGEVSEWVLIVISAMAILMLTGLRIGELVTMPFDCEVEERIKGARPGRSGSTHYGIKYWVEKTRTKTIHVKWISPTAEPVVRACVARIKRLTAAARERAKVLEADPTRVALPPEIASQTILARPELVRLLGYKSSRAIRVDPQGLLPAHGRRPKVYYYVKDLEAYLMSRRVPDLYTIRHEDGTVQMLSESLFVIFAKQSRSWLLDPCRLLVEPVKALTLHHYLYKPTNLFKVFGEEEWERELSSTTHCFRHWLIHVAYKGGMKTDLILRYFAKRYVSGLIDYLHFTTDESDTYAPEELSAGQFYDPCGASRGKTAEGDNA